MSKSPRVASRDHTRGVTCDDDAVEIVAFLILGLGFVAVGSVIARNESLTRGARKAEEPEPEEQEEVRTLVERQRAWASVHSFGASIPMIRSCTRTSLPRSARTKPRGS